MPEGKRRDTVILLQTPLVSITASVLTKGQEEGDPFPGCDSEGPVEDTVRERGSWSACGLPLSLVAVRFEKVTL